MINHMNEFPSLTLTKRRADAETIMPVTSSGTPNALYVSALCRGFSRKYDIKTSCNIINAIKENPKKLDCHDKSK